MTPSITPSFATLFALGSLLVSTISHAALQVENSPGNMTSPTGSVTASVNTIPGVGFNTTANFSNAFGAHFGDSIYFFRSTADPSLADPIHASSVGYYGDIFGETNFTSGAQPGDDNWIYICTEDGSQNLVTNGWVQVNITTTTITPILYVFDAASPATPVTLPQAVAAAMAPAGSPRDVQIKSVDFAAGIIELHNFGTADQDLDGWRFCTHDENQTLVYSSTGGLNGVTVEAGTSLNIHFNNDAPVVDADNINRSSLGSFAAPLDASAYGMALYMNSGFGTGTNMVDYAQWNIGGASNASADERADEAVSGGVWAHITQWISTSSITEKIILTDGSAAELHGNSDFLVLPDFGITSISRNAASNEVTLTWTAVNNLEVTVESSTTLSDPNWPDQTTTSDSSATLTGQTNDADFYRLLFTLP